MEEQNTHGVTNGAKNFAQMLDLCVCPISQEIMNDPVTVSSGHTYERSNIVKWINTQKRSNTPPTDPLTRERLIGIDQLKTNVLIKNLIDDLKKQKDVSILCRPEEFLQAIIAGDVKKFTSTDDKLHYPGKYIDEAKDKDGNFSLHLAVKFRRTKMCRYLLDAGADPNVADKQGDTPLHLLLRQYKPQRHSQSRKDIQSLLLKHKKISVNIQNVSGESPLELALEKGNFEAAELLVAKGADIFHTKPNGQSLLHIAVEKNNEAVVRWLIERGINVEVMDKDRNTPLHLALLNKNSRLTSLFLEKIMRLDLENADKENVFLLAIKYCTDASLLQSFFYKVSHYSNKAGVINAVDRLGNTPLHHACTSGNFMAVKFLYEQGANLEVTIPATNDTILHLAARAQRLDVLRFLLEKLNHQNDQKMLELEIEQGEVRSVYPEHPLIKSINKSGDTLLHIAVQKNSVPMVKLLLTHASYLRTKINRSGDSALHLAVGGGNSEIMQLLLKNNSSDLTALNAAGDTPLHIAIRNGDLDAVRILLKADENNRIQAKMDNKKSRSLVNFKDLENGDTPLHLAVRLNQEDIVSELLKYHPNLRIKNEEGETPYQLADKLNKKSLAQLIDNARANRAEERNRDRKKATVEVASETSSSSNLNSVDKAQPVSRVEERKWYNIFWSSAETPKVVPPTVTSAPGTLIFRKESRRPKSSGSRQAPTMLPTTTTTTSPRNIPQTRYTDDSLETQAKGSFRS